MPAALDALRRRVAELADLRTLGRLAGWDQRTMMPAGGAPARAHHLATLERVAHDRATADELGEWLDELEAGGADLDPLDRDLVRIARRDWLRARAVPADLSAERALATVEGEAAWQAARAAADFPAFAPALRRNVELARAYAACFDDSERPYDALLADYDHGLTTTRLRELFGPLARELGALAAQVPDRRPEPPLAISVESRRAAVDGVLRRLGVEADTWRVDVSAHPFSLTLGLQDSRLTTRYSGPPLESVTAAIHEFGHAVYERQIPAELHRTSLGRGVSMSMHESQSKLWEDHVGRHPAFAPVIAGELTAAGFAIEPGPLHAALVDVRPSPIRVSADPLTYPLHIVLRFELETALVEGSLDVADLPAAWNDAMRRLLGVEVPDDGVGVLQDVHWAAGAFGYFPTYALGCLIAAQLWERLEADLGPQDEALGRGDTAAVRAWLGEHVHRHGRRLDTEALVAEATGQGIAIEPFLRHVRPLTAASPPARG